MQSFWLENEFASFFAAPGYGTLSVSVFSASRCSCVAAAFSSQNNTVACAQCRTFAAWLCVLLASSFLIAPAVSFVVVVSMLSVCCERWCKREPQDRSDNLYVNVKMGKVYK